MPAAAIIQVNSGLDIFTSGCQLQADTGIQEDADGGFDTCTVQILAAGEEYIPKRGSAHPTRQNLYLISSSPRRLPGGYYTASLSYKGLSGRLPGGSAIPAEGGVVGKYSYGIRLITKTWPAGDGGLEGNVPGLGNPSGIVVNVKQPEKTVKVSWVGSGPVSTSIFNFNGSGRGSMNFTKIGPIDEDFYSGITNPAYNFPNGWVPEAMESSQVAEGISLWMNSVTFVGTAKFTPA